MIEAVIFDMDGILIDSENAWQNTERGLFRELGVELTDELLVQSRGLRTKEMVSYWCSRFNIDKPVEEIGHSYDSRMLETMEKEVPLMEGATEALEFFRRKKLPLALASCSSMDHINVVIEKHRLKAYFDHVVSAGSGMPGKPHPEIYLHTARLMHTDPTRCLAIEDSFFGVISALAARMKVIAMPDPHEAGQPRFQAAHATVGSLREINEQLFEKLDR